jgi:hypothetical protein
LFSETRSCGRTAGYGGYGSPYSFVRSLSQEVSECNHRRLRDTHFTWAGYGRTLVLPSDFSSFAFRTCGNKTWSAAVRTGQGAGQSDISTACQTCFIGAKNMRFAMMTPQEGAIVLRTKSEVKPACAAAAPPLQYAGLRGQARLFCAATDRNRTSTRQPECFQPRLHRKWLHWVGLRSSEIGLSGLRRDGTGYGGEQVLRGLRRRIVLG